MDNDRSVPRARLPLLHLPNEINESRARGRHWLLRPVRVLELLHIEGGAVTRVDHLELPEGVVGVVGGLVEDDLQFAILLGSSHWPVTVALDLGSCREKSQQVAK